MQSLEVSILKEYTDEWEQQTKTPSQAERPPWALHHQTHTADDYMEEPQKEMITDAQLPLTANPLPPGGSKRRDGQKKGKKGVKCHTVRAWGIWLVWTAAEGRLKLMQLNEETEETCQFLNAASNFCATYLDQNS